jgi:hypothetical protein
MVHAIADLCKAIKEISLVNLQHQNVMGLDSGFQRFFYIANV